MTDVCFVLMPYAALQRPSIALGLLKSALSESGIKAVNIYANIWFANRIGLDNYHYFQQSQSMNLVGEWTFSQAAFPELQVDDDEFLNITTAGHKKIFGEAKTLKIIENTIKLSRQMAKPFIEQMARHIIKLNPKIVACSSTFEQHCASLALLKRIRELNREIVTFMGGANCEGVMGQTTKREFPWVDFVISGEGDRVVPQLCRQILQYGRDIEPDKLPIGVFSAKNCYDEPKKITETRAFVNDLDKIPFPDYDDYFATLEKLGMSSYIEPVILIETSRGCWWGQKQHCTFCGLNGQGVNYRSKSPDRAIEEFSYLSKRYKSCKFEVVDNILDMRYIKTIMPVFEALEQKYTLFWETKANLQYWQVEQLAKAGVKEIQPGIESVHDGALKLLNKGTTATMNLQLLKWCREFGIKASWNLLLGIPGESDDWYEEIAEWLPLVFHFQPPQLGIIRFDRYSVYHQKQAEYNLNLVPNRLYSYVYPLSREKLTDLAYYFETEADLTSRKYPYQSTWSPKKRKLIAIINEWRKLFHTKQEKPLMLSMVDSGDRIEITDTRPCKVKEKHILTGLNYWIYKSCDRSVSFEPLLKTLKNNYPESLCWHEVKEAIDYLIEQKILLKLNNKFLSLAIREPSPHFPMLSLSEIPRIKLDLWQSDRQQKLTATQKLAIPQL